MPSRPLRRGRTAAALLTPALTALSPWLLLLLLLLPLPPPCRSVHLDVHVPLPPGCLAYHALLANRLLREASSEAPRPRSNNGDDGGDNDEGGKEEEEGAPRPSERVDLFSRHTPHVTLYLADFDLEADDAAEGGAAEGGGAGSGSAPAAERPLNATKVDAFVSSLSSLNLTEILGGWACPLTLARDPATSHYYKVQGAYAMLQVQDTPCLQTLSTALLRALKSYLKTPVEVPEWVTSLAEPQRSAAIYRARTYGSPNVLEGFDPHVTVGYDAGDRIGGNDPRGRSEAMELWNGAYAKVSGECFDEAEGIALGRTGVGGTVLAGSRMGYWKLDGSGKSGGSAPPNMHWNDLYNNEVM